MSRIEDLIKEKCPNGVEYKKLKDIGNTYSGLSGKNKSDFENGNSRYITYVNIYKNPSVKLDLDDYVEVTDNENQNYIMLGDLLIAGSSENLEDSGMVSVVTDNPKEKIYLNSFCFGFRYNEEYSIKILPNYSKHIFRSKEFRNNIIACSFGVTRYNLNKKKFLDLSIPIPSIEIQEEIVNILDKFSELEEELEEELEARRSQYEFWRGKLFMDIVPVSKFMKIDEISRKIISGGTPLTSNSSYYGGNIPWLRTQEIDFCDIYDTGIKITESGLNNSSAKMIPKNCVIVAMYGATVGKVAINKIDMCTNQACCNIEVNDLLVNYKYLFHWFYSKYDYIKSLGQGSQTNINVSIIKNLELPIPSLEEQERIVNILDKFDKLVNDISEGLPAEIEARRKQYEYYRDKLLSFEVK